MIMDRKSGQQTQTHTHKTTHTTHTQTLWSGEAILALANSTPRGRNIKPNRCVGRSLTSCSGRALTKPKKRTHQAKDRHKTHATEASLLSFVFVLGDGKIMWEHTQWEMRA